MGAAVLLRVGVMGIELRSCCPKELSVPVVIVMVHVDIGSAGRDDTPLRRVGSDTATPIEVVTDHSGRSCPGRLQAMGIAMTPEYPGSFPCAGPTRAWLGT